MSNRFTEYCKAVAEVALGTRTAGRGVTVFPEDVLPVSYLRSGSTWVRFLFGNFVHREAVTFSNVGRLVPSIQELPDRKLRSLPRVLKSHECFDLDTRGSSLLFATLAMSPSPFITTT